LINSAKDVGKSSSRDYFLATASHTCDAERQWKNARILGEFDYQAVGPVSGELVNTFGATCLLVEDL
jgi:hypothetical protein